jgi:hypothetical protein
MLPQNLTRMLAAQCSRWSPLQHQQQPNLLQNVALRVEQLRRTCPKGMPGFSVLMRSLLALEKNMKPLSAFLGALGSFFLRGLRAFLPSPARGTDAAAQQRGEKK